MEELQRVRSIVDAIVKSFRVEKSIVSCASTSSDICAFETLQKKAWRKSRSIRYI